MINVALPCLNTQTPKMPHLATLGNAIWLRALHNQFHGSVPTKPTESLILYCLPPMQSAFSLSTLDDEHYWL
jgi:hypothetical protein